MLTCRLRDNFIIKKINVSGAQISKDNSINQPPPSSRAPPYYVGPKAVTSLMSTVARPRRGQGTTSPLLATSTANAGCKESTASSPK